jgi:hypothetical protein
VAHGVPDASNSLRLRIKDQPGRAVCVCRSTAKASKPEG